MPLKVLKRPDTGALTITGTVKLPTGERLRVRQRAQSDRRVLAEEEAAALEAKLLREAFHGEQRGGRSFAEAVIAYLKSMPRSTGDLARLERILLALGDVPLRAVNQEAVDGVRQKILASDAAPATVNRGVITPIRAIMRYAHRRGWCDLPVFEVRRQPKGRTLYLLPAEVERLLAAAAPHLRPLLLFLIGTGARMAEAIELEWRDVDLVGGRAIFWRTKNGEPRRAFLPPAVISELRELDAREGRIFRTQKGLPYADKGRQEGGHIKRAWQGAIRRAGLDHELTPHDLRHTWASWHYALHRDLLALKVEGGWSSVTLVERYAHLLPAGHEEEIRTLWNGSPVKCTPFGPDTGAIAGGPRNNPRSLSE